MDDYEGGKSVVGVGVRWNWGTLLVKFAACYGLTKQQALSNASSGTSATTLVGATMAVDRSRCMPILRE